MSVAGRLPARLRVTGATRPTQVPGNARVAVQFVVNFEEGGENNILDAIAPRRRSCPMCWARSPGPAGATPISNRCSNMLARGFWRLWRFCRTRFAVTVFGVAMALKRNPDVVAAMKEAGWTSPVTA